MRTVPNSFFHFRAINSVASVPTISPPPPPQTATVQRSPWHSPVPYVFGGLAAMLGLIAFAILVLACSYWRHTRRATAGSRRAAAIESIGVNSGEKGEGSSDAMPSPVVEEKFLVIMAGDAKPTFLATPCLSSKPSSFIDETGTERKN